MTVPRETLPPSILAFARDMRDAFGPSVRLKFAATDDGEIFGNPAWDDPGAPDKLRADQAEVNNQLWLEG